MLNQTILPLYRTLLLPPLEYRRYVDRLGLKNGFGYFNSGILSFANNRVKGFAGLGGGARFPGMEVYLWSTSEVIYFARCQMLQDSSVTSTDCLVRFLNSVSYHTNTAVCRIQTNGQLRASDGSLATLRVCTLTELQETRVHALTNRSPSGGAGSSIKE